MAGLRTVGVRLQAEVSGYVNSLRTAKASTQDFVGQLDKAAKSGHLDAVADQAGRMGLVLAAGFVAAVSAAAAFDKQMSSVAAATHASTGEMNALREAALQAGKDTSFSATEAAKGIEELSKAGVSTADVLGGGLKGALSLAAAGELGVGEAAETAASAMTQFKLGGKDVGHIADLLAAGAGKAQGSVHDMSAALNQSGLVASQMGLSIEDTVGTLTAFASAGLMGSDAGTSLKTALLMLANPTKQSKELMQELGISAYDAQGQFIGMSALAGQLQDRLGGLTQEQRNQALATIFGSDAIRAASILYEQGASGVDKFKAAVDDQGYAAETAAMKTNNLAGDIERLKGSLETLAIESGSGANGGLRMLAQGLNGLVDEFGSLPPAVGSTVTILAGVGGAALLAGAGWVKLRRTTADALDELRKTGPAGTTAARGLESASKWAGRAALAFAAFEVASAIVSAAQKDLNPQIDAMGKGLSNWAKGGQLAGESARVLGKDLDDLAVGFKFIADGDNARRDWTRRLQDGLEKLPIGLDGTNTSLTRTRERIDAIDQSLAGLVQGGQTGEASAAFDRLAQSLAVGGVSIEEVRAQFPAYAAALETAGAASGDTAKQIGEVGAAAGQTAEEIDKMAKQFDGLFKVQMDVDEATLAFKQGLVDLKTELVDGKRTLDTNTQAGRDNAGAVLDQIKNIKELRDARYAHGATLDEVNGKYSKDLEGLRTTLLQLGYNKTAVDELVGAYQEIPESATTVVSAPGVTPATKQVQDFNFAVRNVPPSKVVPFWATTTEATAAVNALKAKINELKNKTIYITGSVHWTSSGDLKLPGGTSLKNRWGGLYEHAADGVLRDAHIASPMGDARYAYAEPATGGELFAPKFGDLSRTRAMVDHAVENWWGGKVDWAGRNAAQMPAYTTANTGAITVNVRVDGSVAIEGTGILRGLQKEVLARGGVVQQVLGKKQ